MNTLTFIISILIFMVCVSSASSRDNSKSYPFSFEELLSAEQVFIPSLQYLVKGSNLRLALVSSRQIVTVLPDQEGRVRLRNEKNKNAMKHDCI
jgi:hypothetical protein